MRHFLIYDNYYSSTILEAKIPAGTLSIAPPFNAIGAFDAADDPLGITASVADLV
jgi:hypothetical protein